MKKFISLMLAVITLALTLASCGSDDDMPAGMKLVRGGEDIGYYFYAPEEWTISSYGEISAAHVSSLDNSSVTVVEVKDTGIKTFDKAALAAYMRGEIASLSYSSAPEITVDGEECLWGGKAAVKFVYTYKHKDTNGKEVGFKAMQLMTVIGGDAYLLTYQSTSEMRTEEQSYYDFYLEKVNLIIENFKFVSKKPAEQNGNPVDTDGDGYYLASDKKTCGFELYLPNEYILERSDGVISAKVGNEDGAVRANIMMTKTTRTGVTVQSYLETRRAELSLIFNNFTDKKVTLMNATSEQLEIFKDGFDKIDKSVIAIDTSLKFGALEQAYAYEYTYEYNGTVYHVFQILGVSDRSGYVFTYTADEACYDAYIDEIMTILGKVVF